MTAPRASRTTPAPDAWSVSKRQADGTWLDFYGDEIAALDDADAINVVNNVVLSGPTYIVPPT